MANNSNRFNFDENDRSANSTKPFGYNGDEPSEEFHAFVESLQSHELPDICKQMPKFGMSDDQILYLEARFQVFNNQKQMQRLMMALTMAVPAVMVGRWWANRSRIEPGKKIDVIELEITLRDSCPRIWRRIQVPVSTNLTDLHDIFQVVMGWDNTHMHLFTIDGLDYAAHSAEMDDAKNEKRMKLSIVEKRVNEFTYEYDFGDGWDHDVVLLHGISDVDEKDFHIICTGGENACPPEDCGGIYGYKNMIKEALAADRNLPKHDHFNPELFDLDNVNAILKKGVKNFFSKKRKSRDE